MKTLLPVQRGVGAGIRGEQHPVNTVSPAVINTLMHAKGNHAELAKLHPLARMGEVSDVVDAVLYLQNATFVTGETIRVDGGVHAGR